MVIISWLLYHGYHHGYCGYALSRVVDHELPSTATSRAYLLTMPSCHPLHPMEKHS